MMDFKIPGKLINLVKMSMNDTKCQIKLHGTLSNPFNTVNGVRQGDALSCLLFNIALEKVILDAQINTKGNIFHRSVQILAYADDIDIIARSQSALKETFTRLEESARKMNLRINEEKTKYMPLTNDNRYKSTFIEIGTYKFQTVNNFIYLGSEVNSSNDIKNEIQKRILSANRCFYGLRTYLKSCLISRKTKLLLYKVLIRPVITYASETWALTKADENALGRCERRVLRCILGGIMEKDQWRRRYNSELYKIYKEPDIVKYIKINRLKWAGHLQRMNEERIVRKVFTAIPDGKRAKGRPKTRWKDCISQDVRTIGERNWTRLAMDRDKWKELLRKARAHNGLSCQ